MDYYASSPALVLPPQKAHYFSELNSAHVRQPSPLGRKRYPVPPSLNFLSKSNTSTLGRKRSIQDVEPEDLPADCPVAVPVARKPKPEPIYGPGMTLIYPDDPGFSIAAESQTGTWAEEKNEKDEAIASRPIALSRKSQRRSVAGPPVRRPSEIIDENGNTIDQLIAELGIGWKNLMATTTPATRAYTRVIENHFPLTDVTIMLEKEALAAYLVRANDNGVTQFWLFHDSLQWCQLLSNTLQGAVNNLKAGPSPITEGPMINAQRNTPPNQPSTWDVEMAVASSIALPQDDAMQL